MDEKETLGGRPVDASNAAFSGVPLVSLHFVSLTGDGPARQQAKHVVRDKHFGTGFCLDKQECLSSLASLCIICGEMSHRDIQGGDKFVTTNS